MSITIIMITMINVMITTSLAVIGIIGIAFMRTILLIFLLTLSSILTPFKGARRGAPPAGILEGP